jgi:hypothetical protein
MPVSTVPESLKFFDILFKKTCIKFSGLEVDFVLHYGKTAWIPIRASYYQEFSKIGILAS